MTLEILDEVAFLFVEQFDNLYGMLVDRTDVKRIRKSADDGEDGLFRVAASVFGDKLDDVLVGAANGAMDYTPMWMKPGRPRTMRTGKGRSKQNLFTWNP